MPAAFQLYRKSETFFSDDGTLLAGGYIKFLEAGTTTTKDVFGEKALSTNNGYQIALDASGRPVHAIWGSGQYDVEFYDSDDVKVGEDLMVEVPGGEATALPALVADEFLTSDGAVMSWAEVRQVPSPAGNTGKILGNDGTDVIWQDPPETPVVPALPITVTTGGILIGTAGSAFGMLQFGAASVAGSGGRTASQSVTFATAYNATPKVNVTLTGAAPTSAPNIYPGFSVTSVSTTGFTVSFSTLTGGTSADSSSTNAVISGTVNFNWCAVGTVDEPA